MTPLGLAIFWWVFISGCLIAFVRERRLSNHRSRRFDIENWFHITFDDEWIYLDVNAPESEPWQSQFRWADIERICFQTEELGVSDGIYFFTSTRPESYVVPLDGNGGMELWTEVRDRGLFDVELAIEAAGCSEVKMFCWPRDDQQ